MSAQGIALQTLPLTLTGTVSANRFVKYDGTQAGAGENTMGVARTAGVSGDVIPVDTEGTTVVESGAAITANDTLKADSSGRGITWVTSGGKIAVALQAATAAGQFIEVRLLQNVA